MLTGVIVLYKPKYISGEKRRKKFKSFVSLFVRMDGSGFIFLSATVSIITSVC